MDNVEETIKTYIAKNILFSKNSFPYAYDASLLEEGVLDSMNVLELVSFIEKRFGVNVSDMDITPDNFDSVSKMAAYVMRKNGVATQQ